MGLVTFSLCGKNFQSLINITECIFLFILCLETQCYKHLILYSRCVPEKFISKPIFRPLNSFGMHRQSLSAKGHMSNHPCAHKLSKNWIYLKHAVPLFWHFWSMTSNVYFYLTLLAFTKWSDFFHNKRNWCNKQIVWLSEFKEVIWFVSTQGNEVPYGCHRIVLIFIPTPLFSSSFYLKIFQPFLCFLRNPN